MKDFEKLLVLLYEASQKEDVNYPSKKIEEFVDETREAMLLKKLSDTGWTNIEVKYGIGGVPIVNIKYPMLTYTGVKVAEELLKPVWKKLRFKQSVNFSLVIAFLVLCVNFLSNLDKIYHNYQKYISNNPIVKTITNYIK